MNREKINGYGAIFRFITPLLITINLFMLGEGIKSLREIRIDLQNHLYTQHMELRKEIEHRFTSLESLVKADKKGR